MYSFGQLCHAYKYVKLNFIIMKQEDLIKKLSVVVFLVVDGALSELSLGMADQAGNNLRTAKRRYQLGSMDRVDNRIRFENIQDAEDFITAFNDGGMLNDLKEYVSKDVLFGVQHLNTVSGWIDVFKGQA